MDKLLELLEETPETEYWKLSTAQEAYHKHAAIMAFESAEEIKAKYEQWEPKRKETFAELGEESERGIKARAFYFCLDNAYNKNRAEIRRMLVAEREASKEPASARVAREVDEGEEDWASDYLGGDYNDPNYEAGAVSGVGGWVGDVLRYMYVEKEKAL